MSRLPSYRKHPNGQAFIEHKSIPTNSHRVYLGKWGTPESKRKYQQFIAQLVATEQAGCEGRIASAAEVSVREMAAAYLAHCEGYYRLPSGEPTSEMGVTGKAMKALCDLYGCDLAEEFSPKKLKAILRSMETSGLARTTVNAYLWRIKAAFGWACEEEVIPPHVYHGLTCVRGLKKGRSKAREPEPIEDVPWSVVSATLPHLTPAAATMALAQYYCAMRPQDICSMRPAHLRRDGNVWLYIPPWHKNAWRGTELVKAVPKIAQDLLTPWIGDPEAPMFRLGDVLRQARRSWRGEQCSPDVYQRSIYRACDKAFPPPEPLAVREEETAKERDARLTERQRAELKQWQASHRWGPNRLRHAVLTLVGQKIGGKAAQKWAGHATIATTEGYMHEKVSELVELANRLDQLFQSEH